MTELYDLLRAMMETRRSLRDYSGEPVTDAERLAVLEAARLAPTAGNMCLYAALEIDDSTSKTEIAALNGQPFIAQSSFVVLWLADWQRWYDFYRASDVQAMCETATLEWRTPGVADLLLAATDAVIAAQTAVMAAESLGIGSCYFGTAIEGWKRTRDLLQLPPLAFPLVLTAFGHYPEGRARPTARERLPLSLLHHQNVYRRPSSDDLELMTRSGRNWSITSIGAPAQNVGQRVYLRKNAATFAVEMDRAARAALDAWLAADD